MPRRHDGGGYQHVQNNSAAGEAAIWITSVCVGLLLGFVLTKSMGFLPSLIFKQFRFENYFLFKMLCAALTTTLLVQAIISAIKPERYEVARGGRSGRRGVLSVAVGSFIFGIGIVLAGSSPAFSFIQIGNAIQSASMVLLAGLVAPVIYGFLYDPIFSRMDPHGQLDYLDDYFKTQYWIVAFPLSIAFGALCFLFEHLEPTKNNSDWHSWVPDPRLESWPPYSSGIVVGLLQIPLILFISQRIGSIAAFVTPVAATIEGIGRLAKKSVPAYFQYHCNVSFLWQLVLWGSAAIGAVLTAWSTHKFGPEPGPELLTCFLSALLMHFGTLMSGGGLFEHGITGLSDLRVTSYIGVICLLLGAVATAIVPKIIEDWQSNASFLMQPLVQ